MPGSAAARAYSGAAGAVVANGGLLLPRHYRARRQHHGPRPATPVRWCRRSDDGRRQPRPSRPFSMSTAARSRRVRHRRACSAGSRGTTVAEQQKRASTSITTAASPTPTSTRAAALPRRRARRSQIVVDRPGGLGSAPSDRDHGDAAVSRRIASSRVPRQCELAGSPICSSSYAGRGIDRRAGSSATHGRFRSLERPRAAPPAGATGCAGMCHRRRRPPRTVCPYRRLPARNAPLHRARARTTSATTRVGYARGIRDARVAGVHHRRQRRRSHGVSILGGRMGVCHRSSGFGGVSRPVRLRRWPLPGRMGCAVSCCSPPRSRMCR